MRLQIKTIISLAILLAAFCTLGYTSCNKDNGKSTTVIKCVTCANGGSCINDTCRCPAGYEGVSCQTQSRQKYMGTWEVFEKGSQESSYAQYQISIEINGSGYPINYVTIMGLYNYGFSSYPYINATINGDSIFIPSQSIYSEPKTIVGRGYIHSNSSFGQFGTITMAYQVKDTVTGYIDDFGYSVAVDSPSAWNK